LNITIFNGKIHYQCGIFNSYVSLPKGKSLIRQPEAAHFGSESPTKTASEKALVNASTPSISSAPRQRPSFLAPARVNL